MTPQERSRKGKAARRKGGDRERAAVNRFKNWGLKAERNLSQTRDGGHDIDLYVARLGGYPAIGEVKAKANLYIKGVRDYLGENDWLLLDEDHKPRLYVLSERFFRELIE